MFNIFLIAITSININAEPFINGNFHNRYDKEISYTHCVIDGGKRIGEMKNPLLPYDNQTLTLMPFNDTIDTINGNCYYNVPINESYNEILNIVFYRSIKFHQEFYGMSNSKYYDVDIQIESKGKPLYVIIFNTLF